MKEIEPNPQTPEQLLQLIDLQLAAQKARKKSPERNRVVFLVTALLIIMVGAAAALMMLDQMLLDSHREANRTPQTGVVYDRKF